MDQFFAYHTHSLATVDGIKNCFAVLAASLVRWGFCHSFMGDVAINLTEVISLHMQRRVSVRVRGARQEVPRLWRHALLYRSHRPELLSGGISCFHSFDC